MLQRVSQASCVTAAVRKRRSTLPNSPSQTASPALVFRSQHFKSLDGTLMCRLSGNPTAMSGMVKQRTNFSVHARLTSAKVQGCLRPKLGKSATKSPVHRWTRV